MRCFHACLLLLLTVCACGPEEKIEPQIGFYHWKADLEINQFERSVLDSLQVNRLYVRLFDLDWDSELQMPVPVGEIRPGTWSTWAGEIHPTIFITNKSIEQLEVSRIPWLRDQLIRRMDRAISEAGDPMRVKGWQLDCDWTEGTRARYFALLSGLRDTLHHRGMELSVTIRLHQVKFYERTGVPPVDRGMLMAYNVGEVRDTSTLNSILDLQVLERYIGRMGEYPLSLDLALPLFSWGVLYRDGQLIRLINQLQATDLSDTSRFMLLGEQYAEVRQNTYLWGYYLYSGDRIRLESVHPDLLLEAAARLGRVIKKEPRYVCFYHLDSLLLQSYTYETLRAVSDTLR